MTPMMLVLTVLFAFSAWLFLRPRIAGDSPGRQCALMASLSIVMLSAAATSPESMRVLADSGIVVLGLYALISSGVSAALIVELFRPVFASSAHWRDRTHFSIVAAGWLLLLLVQSAFLFVGRARLHDLAAR